MESIIESLQYALNKVQKDKEGFKKGFEEFISYWEKEVEELKNRELTEDASQHIQLSFEYAKLNLDLWNYPDLVSTNDYMRLDLIEVKLNNSLAIARSNFRSKHKTIWERLIDNIGGIFNIFGKGKD